MDMITQFKGQINAISLDNKYRLLSMLKNGKGRYFNIFIQMFFLSFTALLAGKTFDAIQNIKKLYNFFYYYIYPIKNSKKLLLSAKKITNQKTGNESWNMSDPMLAVIWYFNRKIDEYKHIDQIEQIVTKDINNTVFQYGKKIFRDESYKLSNGGAHLKDDIFIKFCKKNDGGINLNTNTTGDKKDTFSASSEIQEVLLYSYKKNVCFIKKTVDDITKEYIDHVNSNKLDKQHIFVYNGIKNGYIYWRQLEFHTNKSWDSLFIEDKDQIRSTIKQKKNSHDFNRRIGKPNTTTIIADGEPGCGKNSLFKAIMKEEYPDRHLIIIPPEKVKSFEEFEDIFYRHYVNGNLIPPEKRVYQIDEIEKIFPCLVEGNDYFYEKKAWRKYQDRKDDGKKKDDVKKKDDEDNLMSESEDEDFENRFSESKFTGFFSRFKKAREAGRLKELGKWLNFFDGVPEHNDRVIFITTNDYESLDKTFTRPGRIDMRIHLKKASQKICKNIIYHIFKYDGGSDDINKMIEQIEDYKHSQSFIYQSCDNSILNKSHVDNNYVYIHEALNKILEAQK